MKNYSKVDSGKWIEDRGKKEMLNHKSQITNHSPSPDGLGPALLKKGGGLKQYAYSAEVVSATKAGQNTNVLNSKQFRSLGFRILNLFGAWNLSLGIWDLFAICYHSCNSRLKNFPSLLVTHYSSLIACCSKKVERKTEG